MSTSLRALVHWENNKKMEQTPRKKEIILCKPNRCTNVKRKTTMNQLFSTTAPICNDYQNPTALFNNSLYFKRMMISHWRSSTNYRANSCTKQLLLKIIQIELRCVAHVRRTLLKTELDRMRPAKWLTFIETISGFSSSPLLDSCIDELLTSKEYDSSVELVIGESAHCHCVDSFIHVCAMVKSLPSYYERSDCCLCATRLF